MATDSPDFTISRTLDRLAFDLLLILRDTLSNPQIDLRKKKGPGHAGCALVGIAQPAALCPLTLPRADVVAVIDLNEDADGQCLLVGCRRSFDR